MINKINITDVFIERLYSIKAEISAKDIKQARLCLIDFCGAALAGHKMYGDKLHSFASFWGDLRERENSKHKAQKNGCLDSIAIHAFTLSYAAHSTEMDDGERIGMVHPGSVVIPALLALGMIKSLREEDLFIGIITGYEATIWLARTMQPSLKKNGYHATGICGCIGAAIACAAAMNYSKDQMKVVLSAAATTASGLLEAITGDSELKAYNAANAAYSGLMAIAAGFSGMLCPDDVLGGERGLIRNFCSRKDEQLQLSEVRNQLLIHSIYRKPYAACRHCHPAIDCALEITGKNNIDFNKVDKITLDTYDLAVYGHDHKAVRSVASAKMSIPFSMAVAILMGKAGLEEFDVEQINSPDLQKVLDKVEANEDPELSAKVPAQRAARLAISTIDGKVYKAFVTLPKGEPENPISEAELMNKFRDLATYSGMNPEEIRATEQQFTGSGMNIDALLNNMQGL